MTAPFALPDEMAVYTYPDMELIEDGIPCRQVPTFMRPQYAFAGGIIQSHYMFSHHVDFNFRETVIEGSYHIEYSQFAMIATRALFIMAGDVSLTLAVAWVEDRYTNTGDYYCRAYCWRISRETP